MNTSPLQVRFVRIDGNDDLPIPAYASDGAAGFDLRAAISSVTVLAPGERALIPTGFAVGVPPGYELQVRPRSGLAAKHGVTVLNSPGTIDSDYTGPLLVILINLGADPFQMKRGDRIAQGVVASVPRVTLVEAQTLPSTNRGSGGFGSTGRS